MEERKIQFEVTEKQFKESYGLQMYVQELIIKAMKELRKEHK